MIPDLDIYRSAQVLVKQHGDDAPSMPPCGRMRCSIRATWTAMRCGGGILRAVEELQGTVPRSGEAVH